MIAAESTALRALPANAMCDVCAPTASCSLPKCDGLSSSERYAEICELAHELPTGSSPELGHGRPHVSWTGQVCARRALSRSLMFFNLERPQTAKESEGGGPPRCLGAATAAADFAEGAAAATSAAWRCPVQAMVHAPRMEGGEDAIARLRHSIRLGDVVEVHGWLERLQPAACSDPDGAEPCSASGRLASCKCKWLVSVVSLRLLQRWSDTHGPRCQFNARLPIAVAAATGGSAAAPATVFSGRPAVHAEPRHASTAPALTIGLAATGGGGASSSAAPVLSLQPSLTRFFCGIPLHDLCKNALIRGECRRVDCRQLHDWTSAAAAAAVVDNDALASTGGAGSASDCSSAAEALSTAAVRAAWQQWRTDARNSRTVRVSHAGAPAPAGAGASVGAGAGAGELPAVMRAAAHKKPLDSESAAGGGGGAGGESESAASHGGDAAALAPGESTGSHRVAMHAADASTHEHAHDDVDGGSGGSKRLPHAARALAFVSWLASSPLAPLLPSGVLDIAGGAGEVSHLLAKRGGVACVIIDPRPLKFRRRHIRDYSKLRKAGRLVDLQLILPVPTGEECLPAPEHAASPVLSPAPIAAACYSEASFDGGVASSSAASSSGGVVAIRPFALRSRQLWPIDIAALLRVGAVDADAPADADADAEVEDSEAGPASAAAPGGAVSIAIRLRLRAYYEHSIAATVPQPAYIRDFFSAELGTRGKYAALVASAGLVVGFHPDEATEAIVDTALALGKPFAVVPCCVFSRLFPGRRLRDGSPVHSYTDFVAYLQQKADGIQLAFLPCTGANAVLYWLPGSKASPA